MNIKNIIGKLLRVAASICSHIACIASAYGYAHQECGMYHMGWSASPSVGLIHGVPYLVVAIVLYILSLVCSHNASTSVSPDKQSATTTETNKN